MKDNINNGIAEKEINAPNGLAMGALFVILYIAAFAGIIAGGGMTVISVIWLCIGWFPFRGVKILKPNEAMIFTLFGKYKGTLKHEGIYLVNPFYSAASRKLSLKAMTLNNQKQKINDLNGNPVEVVIVVIWRVADTAKAVFAVDNFMEYISIQADSTLRDVASCYPYDSTDENEKSLRASAAEIAESLRQELQKRTEMAGIEIIEARITHLAYAPEIAAVMLQRQQAEAIIDARQKIVDGAVGMVEMALEKIDQKHMCSLDEERKAHMISNLLVVLCGSKDAQPIINSGTLY